MLVLKIIATVCLAICLLFFLMMVTTAANDVKNRKVVRPAFILALMQILAIVTIWVV